MIPTTYALLVCVIFLCGLEETVLSQRGHCAEKKCVAIFQELKDFPGARKRCEQSGGEIFRLEHGGKTPRSLTGGSYWLENTSEAPGGTACSSISVSAGRDPEVLRVPCQQILSGFLCQYTFSEPCGGLQAGGGAQVKYTAPMSFEVNDSETFPPGTIAVAEKAGAEYPDSKHVCHDGGWKRAPWNCEVLRGGCEHMCTGATPTCSCPPGQSLHPNNITCKADAHVTKCPAGYRLAQDGRSCVDVDECKEEEPCTGEGQECENTQGDFQCICKDGFVEEDGVCVNVAICEKCEHMKCEKFNGVYECVCRKGYRVSARDPTKCEQHCAERDCLATCVPNPDNDKTDMLQCFCPDGYIKDVFNDTAFCTDINECEVERQCDHKCENSFGSYRCLCDEGFKLHDGYMCVPPEEEEEDNGSGSGLTSPYPTPAGAHPASVPSYVKTGSVLGISVFMALCAVLLYFLVRNAVKRCGRFQLSTFKHPDMDIFSLQQVTTETYKRLSFDKPMKNGSQIL